VAKVDDGTTEAGENVHRFPAGVPEPPPRSRRRSKDRTGAARQTRFRSKNKGDRYANGSDVPPSDDAPPIVPAVTLAATDGITPPARVTAPEWSVAILPRRSAEHHRIDRLTLLAALALASVSAGYAIYGMTSIFVGAFWPVVGMGLALELGKLRAVTWIGRNASAPWWGLKGALTVLVLVLMGLNVIGAFGFLAKAHIGHQVEGETAVAGRAAAIEARLSVQAAVVADLDRRIAQIDKAVETATSKGRTGSAMALADQRRKTRAELVAQRTNEAKTLAGLQVEKASIEGQRQIADADLGPIRYLATVIHAGEQDVLRWFILIVALLLDPAAVLLLLAATRRRPQGSI